MRNLTFLKESLANFRSVGSVTRSSKFLCKAMIEPIDFHRNKIIVELGPGDGVITEFILKSLAEDGILIVFEINEAFCEKLKTIDDSRLVVVNDSAHLLQDYMKKLELDHIDAIVSALPFVVLPEELSNSILKTCFDSLRRGGLFIQMHYSLLRKRWYEKMFGKLVVNFVPINFPPAFVFVCRKGAVSNG